jgi:hypothetical protein
MVNREGGGGEGFRIQGGNSRVQQPKGSGFRYYPTIEISTPR